MKPSDNWQGFAATAWDDKAEGWNDNSKTMWEHGSRKDILPFFTSYIPPAGKALDIGCGSGYSTYKLHEKGYDITGVDLSEKMINLAAEQFPGIPFMQGDVSAMPFSDGAFASILAINVLEWAEVPHEALMEVHRVLQAGGLLCIGVLGPTAGPRQHSYDRLYGKQVMMNTMQSWEFLQMAKADGFTLVDQLHVSKKWGVTMEDHMPAQAKQALSFMTVFLLKKETEREHEGI